jgi:hypothetical protein
MLWRKFNWTLSEKSWTESACVWQTQTGMQPTIQRGKQATLPTVELSNPNYGHTALCTPTSETAAKQYYSSAKTSCDTHANAKSSSKIHPIKKIGQTPIRLFRPKYTTVSRLPSCTSIRGGGAQPRISKSGAVCMVELKLKVHESKPRDLEHPISGNNRRLKKRNRVCGLPCGEAPCLLRP